MKKRAIRISAALGFVLTLMGGSAFAQTAAEKETKRLTDLLQKLEGTYQIQIIDSREKIAFPLSTLDVIEAKRQQTDTTYFWLKDHVKVVVLPQAAISKPGFTPAERIIYKSTN